MKFSDEGIIISQKKYGENSAVVKVFSRNHGIYRGFVRSTKSSKVRSIYQIGNLISFEFRSRLEENLGSFFAVDLVRSYCSKIIFDSLKLDCVASAFSIIDGCFLERENHQELFDELQNFLQKIAEENDDKSAYLANYVKLELLILRVLGFGIDLSSCVVTNESSDLAFVSPKSGRAVSLHAAKPYEKKLLKLPNFLLQDDEKIAKEELQNGLKLSGFFLQKHVFEGQLNKMDARKKLEKFFD